MKHIILSILFVLLGGVMYAQTQVARYQPGVTLEGITYFLPQTGFHLTVRCSCTHREPGEYAEYAELYLRTKEQQEAQDIWTLDAIDVTPYGVANKNEAYTIRLKSKTSAPLVTLSDDGCLLSINTQVDLPTPLSQPFQNVVTVAESNSSDVLTPEMLAATSKRKVAELIVAEIYDIREKRSLITKGEADFMPQDGEQLRIMMQNLDEQEQKMLQLFRGTSSKTEHVFTFDVLPTGEERIIPFRFSESYGVLASNDLSGSPIVMDIKDLHSLPAVTTPPTKGSAKVIEDMRYCVAGNANVSIVYNAHIYYNANVPMAQFGRVEHLGSELFNKKMGTHVILDPTTGAIRKLFADGMQNN